MQTERTIDSNERKIYVDNSKYLGLDQANVIFYPITRKDLMFMKDIIENEVPASAII